MHVFSNLAISVDGKIATRKPVLTFLGSPEDHREMQRLRRRSDAILIGASTLRMYRRPSVIKPVATKRASARNPRAQPVNVILSTDLAGFSTQWPFFKARGLRRLLIVTGSPSHARLKRFEKCCEVLRLRAKPKKSLAPRILRALKERGIRRLLIEGGGSVLWHFVRCDAIDEYHITLTPCLIGGVDAPTLVEGEGFDPRSILRLQLRSVRRVGSELYLKYGRLKNARLRKR